MSAGEGEDYRPQVLVPRKANLSRLIKRRVDGILISMSRRHRPELFRAACRMHIEGIVSKRIGSAYGSGRCTLGSRLRTPRTRLIAGSETPSFAVHAAELLRYPVLRAFPLTQ
jgi:bifunctional non-homologous end joining protein LigD